MIKINTYYILIQGWRAYGVPTIRSDLPAPNTRRVGDTKVSTCNLLHAVQYIYCNNQKCTYKFGFYGVPTIRSDLPAPDTRPLVNTKVRKKNIHEY